MSWLVVSEYLSEPGRVIIDVFDDSEYQRAQSEFWWLHEDTKHDADFRVTMFQNKNFNLASLAQR